MISCTELAWLGPPPVIRQARCQCRWSHSKPLWGSSSSVKNISLAVPHAGYRQFCSLTCLPNPLDLTWTTGYLPCIYDWLIFLLWENLNLYISLIRRTSSAECADRLRRNLREGRILSSTQGHPSSVTTLSRAYLWL